MASSRRIGRILVIATLLRSVAALWPIPRSLSTGDTVLKLSPLFDIATDIAHSPDDLLDAIHRTKVQLAGDKLQPLVVGRGASLRPAIASAGTLDTLVLSLSSPHPRSTRSISGETTRDLFDRDEGYALVIPTNDTVATLVANTTLGLFRGLTTFSQLWYEQDGNVYTYEAPIAIADWPAFPYRGFMLDTARNYFPVDDIKRTLDAMSWVKLNTFHWHVVDSQSFPLEIPGFPELFDKGPYSASETYTTKDVQEIVDYAAQRGIDVVVEIDTPGHTAVIAEAYPEHIACLHKSPWSQYAAGRSHITTHFTKRLLSAAAELFPSSLFSTGGDEVNMRCYEEDDETQEQLRGSGKSVEDALREFTRASHDALRAQGKTPVVWQEMVLNHDLHLPNDTVVMVWISSEHTASIIKQGFRVVHAPSNYFYLDCGGGQWLGNDTEGTSWCDPYKHWQKAYSFDPFADLQESEYDQVLGGQHLLWTEQSSPENLDATVWPRSAAAAEIFWTGSALPDGSPRNVREALPRMHDLRFRMVRRGVKAIALQPLWCALRPGQCDKVWGEGVHVQGHETTAGDVGSSPMDSHENQAVLAED
ncbi:beta-hexosaminidase [Punctularia strigosozonata HHB-11173 SS5]|uniref:beta-hexosaminidase n=1 Tax=Punctularia strigosozonata (strain HHB-11173) TaxID=741275 RepID=UPI0004417C84|nr:beta-hexosaminidase [Punctularia strigosozonata HHB-11173 SS5]EIN12436.1 beta-hexosaminidase [Punctularia strigosozonata HHB-11173 SS5]